MLLMMCPHQSFKLAKFASGCHPRASTSLTRCSAGSVHCQPGPRERWSCMECMPHQREPLAPISMALVAVTDGAKHRGNAVAAKCSMPGPQGEYQTKLDPPFIPGSECSGVISELGTGVKGLAVGDRVSVWEALSRGRLGELHVHVCCCCCHTPRSNALRLWLLRYTPTHSRCASTKSKCSLMCMA